MNKTIKYRAWDKKTKEYRVVRTIYFSVTGEIEGVETVDSITGRDPWYQDIDEVVLEQCTGLKDKNGKEICEGDIIGVMQGYKPDTWEERGIVVWDGKNARFDAGECIADGDWEAIFPNWEGSINDVEVIGTVNENPGLLVEATK